MGLVMLLITLTAYLGSNYYVAYFGLENDTDARFLSTVWYASPLLWLLVSGTCQMGSHVFEPYLPPRMNLTNRWLTFPEFIRVNCMTKLKFFLWGVGGGLCGIFDEIIASPRLLPLYVLHPLFILGYHADEFAKIKELSRESMLYNNPALDYIGTGGALQPLAGDEVFVVEEKKKEPLPTPAKEVVLVDASSASAASAAAVAVASITAAPAFRAIKKRSRSSSFVG